MIVGDLEVVTSRRAAARVTNPLPAPTHCPYCGGLVSVTTHEEVYGSVYSDWPFLYRCEDKVCDSHVGLHPHTDIPLGTLANPEVRAARTRAHKAFDPLWREGAMTRSEAYSWLAAHLGIAKEDCHISWFDVDTCNAVTKICKEYP